MRNDKLLLQRLKEIFRNECWCKSLFEKAEESQTAQSFFELLKTASSNHEHSTANSTTAPAFPVHNQFPHLPILLLHYFQRPHRPPVTVVHIDSNVSTDRTISMATGAPNPIAHTIRIETIAQCLVLSRILMENDAVSAASKKGTLSATVPRNKSIFAAWNTSVMLVWRQ